SRPSGDEQRHQARLFGDTVAHYLVGISDRQLVKLVQRVDVDLDAGDDLQTHTSELLRVAVGRRELDAGNRQSRKAKILDLHQLNLERARVVRASLARDVRPDVVPRVVPLLVVVVFVVDPNHTLLKRS